MVTFLHAWAIRAFLEVAEPLGRTDDVETLHRQLDRIRRVADEQLWDGDWWIRGFTSDGIKIGSHENEEGKIFLEHQAWPCSPGSPRPSAGAHPWTPSASSSTRSTASTCSGRPSRPATTSAT